MKIINLKESIYYGLFWRGQGHWLPSDINFVRILCGKDEIVKKPILDEDVEYLEERVNFAWADDEDCL